MVVTVRTIYSTLWYAVCVLACIDTGLFVYPSLSRTMLPALCAMTMALIHTAWCIFGRKRIYFSNIQLFVLVWCAYILAHGIMQSEAEQYMLMYLLGTLMTIVVLASGIRDGLVSRRDVENGILTMTSIHIIFIVFQCLGLFTSSNPYFRLTGADENPNITAIALTASIPFVCHRIAGGRQRGVYIALLAAILLSVISLKCRTAYLGIICMSILAVTKSDTARKCVKWKCAGIMAVTVMIVILGIYGYTWKKDSADGRLFIWQRSAEMVVSSPLGVGYGMFERSYNLYQADYFAENDNERTNSTLATACGSAYNDILEHAVQGGIAGGLLFIVFLLIVLWRAYAMQEYYILYAMTAITVMATVNSICYSVTPWIITVAITALIAGSSVSVRCGRRMGTVCGLLLAVTSSYILYNRVMFIYSQWQLKEYMTYQVHDTMKVGKLHTITGTSEAYWRYMAECHEADHDSRSANICYQTALRYTSFPLLLYKAAMCQESCGNVPAATGLLRTACNMLPGNLSLKYLLMKLYIRTGNDTLSKTVAEEILSKRNGRNTESARFIRDEAARLLNKEMNTNAH